MPGEVVAGKGVISSQQVAKALKRNLKSETPQQMEDTPAPRKHSSTEPPAGLLAKPTNPTGDKLDDHSGVPRHKPDPPKKSVNLKRWASLQPTKNIHEKTAGLLRCVNGKPHRLSGSYARRNSGSSSARSSAHKRSGQGEGKVKDREKAPPVRSSASNYKEEVSLARNSTSNYREAVSNYKARGAVPPVFGKNLSPNQPSASASGVYVGFTKKPPLAPQKEIQSHELEMVLQQVTEIKERLSKMADLVGEIQTRQALLEEALRSVIAHRPSSPTRQALANDSPTPRTNNSKTSSTDTSDALI